MLERRVGIGPVRYHDRQRRLDVKASPPARPILLGMKRLILWSHRRRGFVLSGAAVLVLVSALGIRGVTFDADVLHLLPRDGRVFTSFRVFLERFGNLDQLYVVFTAPDGHSARDYDDEIEAWVNALRAAPEIERVDAGTVDGARNWNYVADRQLLLLDDRALGHAFERFRREEWIGPSETA